MAFWPKHIIAGLLAVAASAASAGDPLLGLWRTAPDAKNQTAHVVAAPCGAAFCGTITKIFDPAGQVIAHPNTGKRLFWDMTPTAAGRYEGRIFVPKFNQTYNGVLTITGNSMKVRGCAGPICQTTAWTRVK